MPVSKKKPITLAPEVSTPESPSNVLPFPGRISSAFTSSRCECGPGNDSNKSCVRELEQCIGASWGEYTPTRRGYRNGHYTRDLLTPTGRREDLKVPRDREREFHSQVAGALQSL